MRNNECIHIENIIQIVAFNAKLSLRRGRERDEETEEKRKSDGDEERANSLLT